MYVFMYVSIGFLSYRIVCPSFWLSLRQFGHFLKNGSFVFSDFLYNGSQLEYLKTGRAYFSRKIHFCQSVGKKDPKWLWNRVLGIFWKILSLVLLASNLKWKLMLLFLFHQQAHMWQICGSRVMGQNGVGQSGSTIL